MALATTNNPAKIKAQTISRANWRCRLVKSGSAGSPDGRVTSPLFSMTLMTSSQS